jgi:hypothetical protein
MTEEYSDHVLRLAEVALDRITDLRMQGLRPTAIRMNPIDYEQLPAGSRLLWGVPIRVDRHAPRLLPEGVLE